MQEEGTVVRLMMEKGYGFIRREGQDKDLFFHANELVGVAFNDLHEGDAVTFEVVDSPKGQSATKVSRKEGEVSAAA